VCCSALREYRTVPVEARSEAMKQRRLFLYGVEVALAAYAAVTGVSHAECVPPEILTQPQDQTVLVGDDVSFDFLAGGTAPFFYQWRKDGGDLTDSPRIIVTTVARLSILDVLSSDAGAYDVVTFNSCGITSSEAATLTVLLEWPLGDYNHNGIVDAADYTVWRDTLGSTTDLRANGDDSGASAGVIDAADYLVWTTNFGSSSARSHDASRAIPEPAWAWLVIGAVAASSRRRCHRLPSKRAMTAT